MGTYALSTKPLQKISKSFRRLRWSSARWFQNTISVRTSQGLFTVSSADQCIGKALFCSGQHELGLVRDSTSLLQRLGRFPKNGKGTIVDLGANVGPISIGFLNLGLADKAIAVEPDPTNFSLLERNVAQNDLQECMICLPYAVSDCATQVQFELCDWNPGDHRVRCSGAKCASSDMYDEQDRTVIDVPCEQIDKLLQDIPDEYVEQINLVWIDVQGHEGQVFRGGANLFARDIPVMAEIWPYGLDRSGMSQDEFCDVARHFWSEYWRPDDLNPEALPIASLSSLIDTLRTEGRFENVIFLSAS